MIVVPRDAEDLIQPLWGLHLAIANLPLTFLYQSCLVLNTEELDHEAWLKRRIWHVGARSGGMCNLSELQPTCALSSLRQSVKKARKC